MSTYFDRVFLVRVFFHAFLIVTIIFSQYFLFLFFVVISSHFVQHFITTFSALFTVIVSSFSYFDQLNCFTIPFCFVMNLTQF